MPVTARLSKAFYEAFGEQVVNELVELLNLVDATSRSDLRELNAANFARFDATLDQRVALLEAKIESVETRINARLDSANLKMEATLAHFAATMKDDLAKRFSDQTRFLYLGWALQFAAILGLWLR